MGATRRLGFRPRRRLRHLKEIRLVGLFGGEEGEEDAGELFFEVHCRMPGEAQEMVLAYRSEKVPSERNMVWSPIEVDLSTLAPSVLNGRHSGNLTIKIFRTTMDDCPLNEGNASSSEPHYEKVMDVEVDLNTLVPWTFDRGIQFQLVDGCYGASSVPDISNSVETSSNEADKSDLERILSGCAASISGEDELEDTYSSVVYCKSCKHAPVANLDDLTQQIQARGPGNLHSSSSAPNLAPEDDALNNSLEVNLQSNSKVYDLTERRSDIRRLLATHRSLCELADRHRRLHRYITDALLKEEDLHQKRMKLKQQKEALARYRARCTRAEAKLDGLKSKWNQNQEKNLHRVETLEDAAEALHGACQRWKDAEEVLAGPQGVGKLRDLQLELVTRRSRMVTSLSRLYELGPRTASDPMVRANQLEECFNQRWYMGRELVVPGGNQHRLYQYSDGFLSIMGLELPPSLAELVKNGDIGLSNEPELCQRAAAALGYVAHFVNLCSKYLDIPLRYPIKHWGSTSLIYNWATSADRPSSKSIQGPWVSVSTRRMLAGPSDDPPSLPVPMEFTLFYQGATRSKFAFAVFLLGKDVQQLLSAHGIKPSGSKYILQNLHNLVAAAYSGLVHHQL